MEDIRKEIEDVLKEKTGLSSVSLEIPEEAFGDYAFPCFQASKALKKAPQEIARELCKTIPLSQNITKIEVKGGYLNFFINKVKLAEEIITQIQEEKSQYGSQKHGKKIMVEYSSPNTNKPLHLGHVRNIAIGESISNILSFLGNDVIRACLVNDRGIHIAKSMLAYKKYGKNSKPDKKSDHFVGDYYVLYNEKLDKNPKLEIEAQEMLVKWENSDPETIALWKQMNKWVYKGFEETYKEIGVTFDTYYYESDLYKGGKEIVQKGYQDKIFTKKDGAIVAELEEFGLPDKVLIRKDGTSIYMTQDIYLAEKKAKEHNLDASIYVVGSEQILHFKQLFKILELLGFSGLTLYHVAYGMVYLPEGKMKSREGHVVDADEIIDKMKSLAEKEIVKRHKTLGKKEINNRKNIIANSAIKFYMLKHDAYKDMNYDPQESISFEGETGPYVQYAYARIASILRKHGKELPQKIDYDTFSVQEQLMIRFLSFFPKVVGDASRQYKPSLITRYLLDCAKRFNEYYQSNPILKAPPKLRDSRLVLIQAVQTVLQNGLQLLDIDTLEEM